jgi:putative protease
MDKPKLLSPVSSLESAVGVVSAGADEIYCAVEIPGAEHVVNRPAACCVPTYEELGQIVRHARSRDVDTIVTLELPFMSEFMTQQMRDHISSCADQGIDAWIVGDLGLITLVQEMDLGIPIYASTYFVAMNHEAVNFLRRIGVQRVVLDRHMAVEEIRQVMQRAQDVEIEVFIHGSGCSNINFNCYLEGGRRRLPDVGSEYRGIKGLPTPCRTPFDIYEVGEDRRRLTRAPILDAYTFCSLCQIPDLMEMGVTGLKIVGRCLPTAFQVQTADMYRRLVDLIAEESARKARRSQRRRIRRMVEPFKEEPYQPVLERSGGLPSASPSIRDILCGEERCYYSSLFHVPYRSSKRRRRRLRTGAVRGAR